MAQDIFNLFSLKRILVLGDVMIDAYLEGKVNRISPEAPVPILSFENEEKRLGGAANVAINLSCLGATTIMASVIGDDENGKELLGLFHEQKISTEGVIISKNRKTTVKTRVIGNNQQLLRVDNEQCNSINESEESLLIARITEILEKGVDAVIFEDYNKGVLTKNTIEQVLGLCKKFNIITSVDPKKDNFFSYHGVSLFKPNLKELKDSTPHSFDVNDRIEFENAVSELKRRIDAENVMITLSEKGVYICNDNQKFYFPAHYRNIADVSGAGDTVISVATLCLLIGLSADKIAAISNLAGGLVCEQVGVVPINRDQLKQELERSNLI
jgi:rfaE bifunctional protein kinase chain/domain